MKKSHREEILWISKKMESFLIGIETYQEPYKSYGIKYDFYDRERKYAF
jgi:hypothetical protein